MFFESKEEQGGEKKNDSSGDCVSPARGKVTIPSQGFQVNSAAATSPFHSRQRRRTSISNVLSKLAAPDLDAEESVEAPVFDEPHPHILESDRSRPGRRSSIVFPIWHPGVGKIKSVPRRSKSAKEEGDSMLSYVREASSSVVDSPHPNRRRLSLFGHSSGHGADNSSGAHGQTQRRRGSFFGGGGGSDHHTGGHRHTQKRRGSFFGGGSDSEQHTGGTNHIQRRRGSFLSGGNSGRAAHDLAHHPQKRRGSFFGGGSGHDRTRRRGSFFGSSDHGDSASVVASKSKRRGSFFGSNHDSAGPESRATRRGSFFGSSQQKISEDSRTGRRDSFFGGKNSSQRRNSAQMQPVKQTSSEDSIEKYGYGPQESLAPMPAKRYPSLSSSDESPAEAREKNQRTDRQERPARRRRSLFGDVGSSHKPPPQGPRRRSASEGPPMRPTRRSSFFGNDPHVPGRRRSFLGGIRAPVPARRYVSPPLVQRTFSPPIVQRNEATSMASEPMTPPVDEPVRVVGPTVSTSSIESEPSPTGVEEGHRWMMGAHRGRTKDKAEKSQIVAEVDYCDMSTSNQSCSDADADFNYGGAALGECSASHDYEPARPTSPSVADSIDYEYGEATPDDDPSPEMAYEYEVPMPSSPSIVGSVDYGYKRTATDEQSQTLLPEESCSLAPGTYRGDEERKNASRTRVMGIGDDEYKRKRAELPQEWLNGDDNSSSKKERRKPRGRRRSMFGQAGTEPAVEEEVQKPRRNSWSEGPPIRPKRRTSFFGNEDPSEIRRRSSLLNGRSLTELPPMPAERRGSFFSEIPSSRPRRRLSFLGNKTVESTEETSGRPRRRLSFMGGKSFDDNESNAIDNSSQQEDRPRRRMSFFGDSNAEDNNADSCSVGSALTRDSKVSDGRPRRRLSFFGNSSDDTGDTLSQVSGQSGRPRRRLSFFGNTSQSCQEPGDDKTEAISNSHEALTESTDTVNGECQEAKDTVIQGNFHLNETTLKLQELLEVEREKVFQLELQNKLLMQQLETMRAALSTCQPQLAEAFSTPLTGL